VYVLVDTQCMRKSTQAMELDLLERRIRRLVAKLEKVSVYFLLLNFISYSYLTNQNYIY